MSKVLGSKETQKHKRNISKGLKKAYTEGRRRFTMTEGRREKLVASHIGKKGYWAGKKRPEITGENHYKWAGGRKHGDRVRFRDEMQKKVFERDDYTCQLCGNRGGQLQVDHIQSWAEYVELRFNIENCRTLCMSCHYKVTFGKPMPPTVRAWGHKLKEVMSYK